MRASRKSNVTRKRLLVVPVLAALLGPLLVSSAASAAPILTVTPITWNVIGLDSNAVNTGPNVFPVGARVCNTGDAAATNVQASFVWDTSNAFINLAGASSLSSPQLAAGGCVDFNFEVVITRTPAAYDTVRRYHINVTADGLGVISTPIPREVYVEHLVSQARNDITSISGPATVYVGQTYNYTLVASTATNGYEQLETFLTFPNIVFRVDAVSTSYSAPAGGTNNKVYADACGWDNVPTSATYRECIGPANYTGAKAGGNITTTFTVTILSAGSASLTALIYDFSGSSYHYNGDYGIDVLSVTAQDSANLSMSKSDVADPVPAGEDVIYDLSVANAGPSTASSLTVTDTLPAGTTFVSASGIGWTCVHASGVVTCTRGSLAVGETAPDINVRVTAPSSGGSITNTASVSSSTHDPTGGNDTDTEQTMITPSADLEVATSDSADPVTAGSDVDYTLTVTNHGVSNATDLTVTDTLPAGTTFVSATGNGWTCAESGGSVTCTRPGLAAGASAPDINVRVTTASAGTITNTAEVTATEADAVPANNVDSEDTVVESPVTPPANAPPVAADDSATTSAETPVAIGVTANDSDPDGNLDPSTVTVTSGPSSGTAVCSTDGVCTYTPTLGFSGPDQFDYEVCDTGGACDTATVSINVEAVPPPPPANNPPVAVDDAATTPASTPVAVGVAANDSDPDGNLDPATVQVTSGPADGIVSCSIDGVCTYTPDPGFGGTDGFDYQICDTDAACDTGSVSITVTSSTDLILTASDTPDPVTTGSNYDYILTVRNDGPSDATGVIVTNVLPQSTAFVSAGGTGWTCSVSGRRVTCDRPALATGTSAPDITITATAPATPGTLSATAFVEGQEPDPNPGNNLDTEDTDVLAPPNDPPVAVDDTATTAEGTPVAVGVAANDSDADGNLDPSTVRVTSGPAGGTVVCDGFGVCTYTPDPGFSGADGFEYEICDTAGSCDTGSVSITVTPTPPPPPPPNDPPVAVDDAAATVSDTPVAIGVTANDSDPDGNLDPSTVQVTGGPGSGTVVCGASGVCTYTPTAGFSGTDGFDYQVCDAAGACDTASVVITVTAPPPAPPVNNPPVAVDDSATTATGAAVAIGVSANDSDPDGNLDPSTVQVTSGPSNGIVSCAASGVCSYTPAAGFSGTDAFDYQICDTDGACDTASVSITVTAPPPAPPAVNNPPVAVDDSATTAEGTAVAIGVSANDSDPDGNLDHSTVQVISGPRNGTVTCAANGACTYTPNPGFSGADSFDYAICDTDGSCDTGSVSITVTEAPREPSETDPSPSPTPSPTPTPTPTPTPSPSPAPVPPPPPSLDAIDDTAETVPRTAVVIEVVGNDEVPVRDEMRLTDNTDARDGSVTCTRAGICVYSPGEAMGMDIFDYTICIEGDRCDSARVRVSVLGPGSATGTAAPVVHGELPFTGRPIMTLLLLAAFLLATGTTLLSLSRRRMEAEPSVAAEAEPTTGAQAFSFSQPGRSRRSRS